MNRVLAFASLALTLVVAPHLFAEPVVRQWVSSNADGVVSGRVIVPGANAAAALAVNGADVVLVNSESGEAAGEAVTGDDGVFNIADIQPGVYSLSVQGEYAFAFGALHVLENGAVDTGTTIDIAAARLDLPTVKTAIVRYLPSKLEPRPMTSQLPPESLTSNGTPSVVALTDGGLNGRLFRDATNGAANSNVFIFKDGNEVARVLTDDTGKFRVEDLGPGAFSLIAVGPDGLAACGFDLIDSRALGAKDNANGKSFVADGDAPTSLGIQVAPPVGSTIISDRVISEQVVDNGYVSDDDDDGGFVPFFDGGSGFSGYGGGMAGGGGGGFYGGGGGGVPSSGGGLGAVAALGGLGAAIAVAASDDDQNVVTQVIASPIIP